MDAEELYYQLLAVVQNSGFEVTDATDIALSDVAHAIADMGPAHSGEVDKTFVAPGFTLHPPSIVDEEPRWLLTGVLPLDERAGHHYELEDALIKAGLLTRAQCDSESGQFFVYPKDKEQGLAIGAFIKERLTLLDKPTPSIWED